MTKSDNFIGIGVGVIGLLMILQTYFSEYAEFPNDPGPILMPQIIGILLIICALGLIFWPKVDKKNEHSEKSNNKKTQKTNTKRMFVVMTSLVFYTIILDITGFIVSTIIFLSFSIWYLNATKNKKTLIASIITSVLVTVSVNYIFYLLDIPMHKGMF